MSGSDNFYTEKSWIYKNPPLVTVIIINYNYEKYLIDAIKSVYSQTYSHIECIFVDNASTDGSAELVEAAQKQYRDLIFLRRASNDGQTAAAIDGLAKARGKYIVFLDADDMLLPHGVAMHIQTHLSSRVHAGFTCGHVLQLVDDEVIVTAYASMSDFIYANRASPALMRDDDADILPRMNALSAGSDKPISLWNKVYLVPESQSGWVWSPTSALSFRKDALDLFCDNTAAKALTSQTDLYLCLGINAVTGSILIDEPVATYRLHGSNVFATGAQLNGRFAYSSEKTASLRVLAHQLLIDHFLVHSDRFVQQPSQLRGFFETLRRLDHSARKPMQRSYLLQAMAKYRQNVKKITGSVGSAILLLVTTGDVATAATIIWDVVNK